MPLRSSTSPRDSLLAPRWAKKLAKLRHWLFLALPIGLAAGLGVAILEMLCNAVLWRPISSCGPLWRAAAPLLGLLISGWILAKLKVRTIGMLNDVVVQYHHPPYELHAKRDLLQAGACIATVGFGASLSLGGPSQWLGARMALYLRRLISRFQPAVGISTRQVLLIGAAAGVGAYLRAPLAGAILAMETPFRRDVDGTVLLPASIASLIAHTVHARLADGNPLVHFANLSLPGLRTLAFVLALGAAAGFFSRLLQWGVLKIRDWTASWPWSICALCGGTLTALTALLAWRYFGQTWTLQGGLPLTEAVFQGQFGSRETFILLLLKLTAVWAALGTTGVAGVLVVTLTLGTLLGGTLHALHPACHYALTCSVAICAYLAANYNAPLTALALSLEWGGSALLYSAWPAVIVASWIGAGMPNTPAKVRHRFARKAPRKENQHVEP